MSENCYSTLSFFGNKDVLSHVDKWASDISNFASSTTDPKKVGVLFKLFTEEGDGFDLKNAINYFGPKWVYPDSGAEISLMAHELGFVSSDESPDALQDAITELLAKIDKNVVVLNTYSIDDGQEGFRYTLVEPSGEIFSEVIELELFDADEEDDSDDGEDNEKGDFGAFYEGQCDVVSEIIDSFPGTKKNLKKHAEFVEQRFMDMP